MDDGSQIRYRKKPYAGVYERGRRARIEGQSRESSPYPVRHGSGASWHKAWLTGWLDADVEIKDISRRRTLHIHRLRELATDILHGAKDLTPEVELARLALVLSDILCDRWSGVRQAETETDRRVDSILDSYERHRSAARTRAAR